VSAGGLPSKAAARVYPHERVADADLAAMLEVEERARGVGLTYDEATAYQARLSGCARGLLIEVGATRPEVERLRAAQEGVAAAWAGVVAKLGDLGRGWDGDDSAILQDRVNDMKAALAKAVRS
jgi:hypothetical protein